MDPTTRRQFLAASASLAAAGTYVVSSIAAQPAARMPDDTPQPSEDQRRPAFGQGIMLGEVTATSIIVQARVTRGSTLVDGEINNDGDPLRDGDLPGIESEVEFTLVAADDANVQPPVNQTLRAKATADNDHIARVAFTGLTAGLTYGVKASIRQTQPDRTPGTEVVGTFKTHPGPDASVPVKFVLSSCMNYDKYTGSDGSDNSQGYQGKDRALGYPAAEAVLWQKPDFMFFAGDVVYYDKKPQVKTLADMRAKWHRQNNLPRMMTLHAMVPGYWMKDDHDHRSNDSDATKDYFPSHELGIQTFREQCPIFAQGDNASPTYRTHRVSRDLQIWMLEGRDYRSANKSPDGPDKTLWGQEQEAWLKVTLLESDATYRIIISPTPLVGPDDAYKADNHTNSKGFQSEGKAFKQWGAEHGLWGNTFLMCGDRHWQYHSIDPTGAHEFSCGAFNDENSRMGRKPGDKNSTDPDALVTQRFTSPKPTGGFITIAVETQPKPTIRFEFCDDLGEKLYVFEPGKG